MIPVKIWSLKDYNRHKMNLTITKKGSMAFILLVAILPSPMFASPLLYDKPCDEGNDSRLPSSESWKKYDINHDGKFDRSDIDELIDQGPQIIDFDLNNDGKKDFDDALALFLQLSIMDRSCDRQVDEEDFAPVDTISMPEVPEINTVRRIVNDRLFDARTKLPIDIEDQAFSNIPAGKILSIAEKEYVYQMAGMSGLAQQNLDAGAWGFGRAFQLNERSAGAIGSLAFCLMSEDRDQDALLLLAYARHLFRESAPTATSLGWIYARHGQNKKALEHFREAVCYAPGIAQYHMNLGILLMRMGLKRDAFEEFREATELDPADVKKILFWYTTKPPDVEPKKKPFDPEEFRKQTEIEITELEEQGFTDDVLPEPWDQMSPCDQAQRIPELLDRRYGSQMETIAQSYSDNLAKQIEAIIKGFWPQWKNITEDWDRYIAGIPVVTKSGERLTLNAEIAAGNRRVSLTRQMGSELLGYSSFFMESALRQAKAEANLAIERLKSLPITAESFAELRAEAYQDALDEAIRQCYKAQIDQAYRWLTAKSSPYSLPKPSIETINTQDFLMLFMVIPLECFNIKDYCPDGDNGDPRKPEMPVDHTVSLDLIIVSFEWNTDTDEIEFNVGQGIIVGVTWTPETGFGFQIGAGIDLGVGPIGVEEAIYARFDEGRITIQSEEGVSFGVGPLSAGYETTNIQATVEL
jgi:tetratricopeptide (TPR) repeat protein